jgi:hypothetical protein
MRRLVLTLAVLLSVHPVYANRVFSSGFEIGSVINGVEWNTGYLLPGTTQVGVRTGVYAGHLPPYTSGLVFHTSRFYVQVPPALDYYARCYIRFDAFPQSELTFFQLNLARVSVDNGGVLRVRDVNGLVVSGSTLSLGVYYQLELRVFSGGTPGFDESRLRIDGVDDATLVGADYGSAPITLWEIGRVQGAPLEFLGEFRLDDCAINDTLGAANNGENTWPGPGSIVHLRPNDEGDPDSGGQTISQQGCTETTRHLCLRTNDTLNSRVELNRATSFVDVGMEDFSVPVGDQIQLVSVGIIFTCAQAKDVVCNHVLGVKSQSAGTVATATTPITLPTGYIYYTHAYAISERRYRLTQYLDPQNSGLRWVQATINSMQVRVATSDGNPDTHVSTVWALIEYEPQVAMALTLSE